MPSLGDLVREQVEAHRAMLRGRRAVEQARSVLSLAQNAEAEANLRYNTACAAVDKAIYDEVCG